MTRGTRIPRIETFKDSYAFLSNFYRCSFTVANVTYPTTEHFFQAAKAIYREDFLFVLASATPGEAKRRGGVIQLREDWERDKEDVMRMALKYKFGPLAERLLATGDAVLVEGNNHKDDYWGVYRGKGKNRLGVLLMERRDELKAES